MKAVPKFLVTAPSHFRPFSYELRFAFQHDDGTYSVAQPVTLAKFDPSQGVSMDDDAMMRLKGEDANAAFQSLLDSLWNLGFRPSDIGTPGHLAATKEHLADMRKLVAKTYGVEL